MSEDNEAPKRGRKSNKHKLIEKYVANDPEETGDTFLYHADCPEGKVFQGLGVAEAIEQGWFNDV